VYIETGLLQPYCKNADTRPLQNVFCLRSPRHRKNFRLTWVMLGENFYEPGTTQIICTQFWWPSEAGINLPTSNYWKYEHKSL